MTTGANRNLIRAAMEAAAGKPDRPKADWEKRDAVFKSTYTAHGKVKTHPAVNWRKIEPLHDPEKLKRVRAAWETTRDRASGYAGWDDVAKASKLPIEVVAGLVKGQMADDPECAACTVDRMGNNTFFKFKKH
jgi:hypothetical protein